MNNYRTIQQKDMQKLFPAWEHNIPTLGTKHSQPGNKTALRLALSLLLMFVLGINTAWGQDYSGKYFLSGNNQGTNSYDIANTTTNYYLCPTVDWLYYDANATNYFTNVDNEQPFITTYQYRNGVNDASEAVWEFVKDTNSSYYYIKHNKTQKYLVSNQSIITSGANRLRVHLEETAPTEQTLDNYLFAITYNNSGYFNISPKYQYNKEGIKYLNVTQGNQPSLKGTNAKNDGPTGEPTAPQGTTAYNNIGGTIGLWTIASDYTSKWYIELYTPEISVDNCTFTLSYPIEDNTVEIRYTTDGTAPTASSTLYEGPFTPGLNAVQIKVTAFKKNISAIKSPTASYYFSKLSVPTCELNQEESKLSLNTSVEDGIIYYKTGGANPTISEENEYTGPFPVTENTIVKAFVAKQCYTPSDIITHEVTKVATPTFELLEDNKVKISSETQGVTIYYNIGDDLASLEDPNTSSNLYAYPLTVETGKYFKAIAVKSGCFNSSVATTTEAIKLKCAKPSFKREGRKLKISSSFPSNGCTIKYEIADNGGTPADPNSTSSTYTELLDLSSYTPPITVKAYVSATGYSDSGNNSFTISSWGTGTEEDPYVISSQEEFNSFVTNVNTNANDEANKYYQLIVDVNGGSAITTPFTGSLVGVADDEIGSFPKISGLTHPLFNTLDGGVVKNVILENVKIEQSGNVGAIAGEAKGYTRIYNCGILPSSNKYENEVSYVKSTTTSGENTGYCGGLVGWLKDDSRVINCFSYANIKGGTYVAGIVGYNDFASTTKVTEGKYTELKTAIVNCIFYGNITDGTNRYPVYGGKKILNNTETGINNYDFYRAEANLGLEGNDHYNCSWPAMEEYLTKYEYYRYLLNSNRELCGWWVGAPSAPSDMLIADVQAVAKDASLMAKWVLDPSIAPYPILKAPGFYPSAVNKFPRPDETNPQRIAPETKKWVSRVLSTNTDMPNPKAAPETDGRSLGKIKVTIKKNSSDTGDDKDIIITAMDIDNNDFNYGKIQLPYYNSIFGDPNGTTWEAKYGGNYTDNVVVGWTISSSSGTNIPSVTNQSGTDENGIAYDHTYSTNSESGYNFADRYCTTKDANRVFAQGGYYYVPYGVSEITITAKWANAIYLDNGADHSYDRVYMSYNIDPNKNKGFHFAPAGSRPLSLGNGKTVQTASISSQIPSGSVYENAIVLVGNHQYRVGNSDIGSSSNGCTIISADFDLDDEPDYSLIWQLGQGTGRQSISPIRFDFLPVIEMGMAMKEDGSTQYYSLGCYRPLGHFEVTETTLIHFGQFEFGNQKRTTVAPLILNGGIYDQFTKGTGVGNAGNDVINYMIIGGNVYMPSFTPGAHVNKDANYSTRHCPVNVIGGRISNLYLTGNFNNNVTPNADNPHCYIDGGNFKQVAAAGKEGINGNVYFKINHSIIEEFYGGSTLADKLVTGNINVTIDNSKVTKYCGGPKFGNMNLDEDNPANNKTVTTNATGTTFGVYYGGGNGGTSYVQYDSKDNTVNDATGNFNWGTTGGLNGYTPNTYRSGDKNYMADYEMEIVNTSTGTDAKKAIFRTYLYAAQFSATNTGPITNNLTDCKVLTSFYGGGNLGGVIGDVTSTLTDTEVMGSAFGAGFSASVPEVTIYNKDKTAPTINVYTGIITPTPDPDPNSTHTTYTWTNKTSLGGQTLSTSNPAVENVNGKNYFYTEEPLVNLGAVSGAVTLKINGNSNIGHDVFGGGDSSAVVNTTNPANASTTVKLQGNAQVQGNVFGGGNRGLVSGTATVNVEQ